MRLLILPRIRCISSASLTAYHYDPRKWLDTLIATKSGVDLSKQYLTFDDAGQITKQVSEHGTSGALRQDYEYDALGQLTGWVHDSGGTSKYKRDYDYDSVGNRTYVWSFGTIGTNQRHIDDSIGCHTSDRTQVGQTSSYIIAVSLTFVYRTRCKRYSSRALSPFNWPSIHAKISFVPLFV